MSDMKIVIVSLYPYNSQGLDSWIDHGAGMTYTAAKKAGCDIDFLDMKSLHNDAELQEKLKGYDLVAISMKSSYYAIGMKVTKFAKAQGSKVMIGGYHATAAPNELIENPDIDYIFHGEGEITFPQFLKSPHLYKREIRGEKPPNLDSLHFIDRSIYREPTENCLGWWHGNKLSKMVTVMAARGCPYKCAFCQPLEDNHFGKKLRRRSPRNLIDELAMLKKRYNPDCVMIHDDTFFINMSWLEEFAEQYYNHIRLPFWASARADGICDHPYMVKTLVNVGWELISVGFESGSQRILDKLKKGTTVAQNLEAAKIIKSCGAKIYANYITAIPWETKWDIQATAKMADEIAAEMPSWAYFAPYPGCELGEECIKKGWSLLDRETYDRCPSGEKVKHVDYDYIGKVRQGFREEVHPEFCDIIIPTYENEEYTIACLKSIKKHTKEGTYRIIWVDNGSKAIAGVDHVIENMNHITIKLPKNEGFVGATNKGLEVSDAPIVCLLNNDTEVSARWLEKLTATLYSKKEIGIVGPLTGPPAIRRRFDSHHNITWQQQLRKVLVFPEWSSLDEFNIEIEKQLPGVVGKVDFVGFLCALIKREVIDKVGHLDPNYEMGLWDDADYARMTQKAGYETVLSLDTCIYHKGRTTFNMREEKEGFDTKALLKKNRAYLDNKWKTDNIVKTETTVVETITTDTIIISRAIYNTMGTEKGIGVLSEDRLAIMQRYFVNSLKNQTDQDFILYLIVGECENETTKRIEALDWDNLTVQYIYTDGNLDEWKNSVRQSRNWGQEKDIGCPEDIVRKCGHPQANIMARLDTDDWVAPGWIAHMKHMATTKPESHFLISYQVVGQGPDGRLYRFFAPHNQSRTSSFIALVQKEEPRISPYEDVHLKMGKLFASVYTISPSYAFMVVHKENRSNKLYQFDRYFEDIEEHKEGPKKETIKQANKSKVKKIKETKERTNWRARIACA